MIDRPYGDFAQMLRSPDLRLGGIDTVVVRGSLPMTHSVARPDRGVLAFTIAGAFILDIEGSDRGPITVPRGTAIGFESGRAHRWTAVAAESNGEVALFVSSIPRRMGVLQRLEDGVIIVPADVEPHATILWHAVALHAHEHENAGPERDDAVIRRCAEICMIELVRYARDRMAEQRHMPAGLAHDEALLRAWSAYFAEPQRKWTLQALANAAGLSRTAFAQRFRTVFGAPPVQTLTALRLEQAEAMLRDTRAPLIEIAFTVGYNSEAAFVRAFHRQYGVPPGRFRTEQSTPG